MLLTENKKKRRVQTMDDYDLFSDEVNQNIFYDLHPLSLKYIPDKIIDRDNEIEAIKNSVAPVLSYGEPTNGIIFGDTGTGKNVVTWYVLKNLQKHIENNPDIAINVKPIFIKCKMANTPTDVLLEIINKLDQNNDMPRAGISVNRYYQKLWEIMEEKQQSIIIVFDEIENLKDLDILYNFSRADFENEHLFIGMYGLTNNAYFTQLIDPRIISSMGSNKFVFEPYNATELQKILDDRAKIAFKDGALDESVIPLCSALSAPQHGDARKAITLLKTAGMIAQEEKNDKVTEDHVYAAQEKINKDHILEIIRSLPKHSKVTLLSISKLSKKHNKVNTKQVYNYYKKICPKVNLTTLSQPSVSEYIKNLDMYGLINTYITNKGRGNGRIRWINIESNVNEIINVLEDELNL